MDSSATGSLDGFLKDAKFACYEQGADSGYYSFYFPYKRSANAETPIPADELASFVNVHYFTLPPLQRNRAVTIVRPWIGEPHYQTVRIAPSLWPADKKAELKQFEADLLAWTGNAGIGIWQDGVVDGRIVRDKLGGRTSAR